MSNRELKRLLEQTKRWMPAILGGDLDSDEFSFKTLSDFELDRLYQGAENAFVKALEWLEDLRIEVERRKKI